VADIEMTVALAGVDAARPMTVAQKVSATSSFDLVVFSRV
jgi:hypothetical protein